MSRLTLPFAAVATVTLLSAAGCALPSLHGGIPVVAKPQSGALLGTKSGPPDIERGKQALIEGDTKEAIRNLLPLAKRGYPDAQFYLAEAYSRTDSVETETEAVKWYRIAQSNRPEADLSLARVLMKGGVNSNPDEIMGLIEHAAKDRGDPGADAVRLEFYTTYPQFESREQSKALAERLSTSPLLDDLLAAINWYRANVAADDNVQKLADLCTKWLDSDLSCAADLAHLYRYNLNRPGLEKHVARSLAAFEKAKQQAKETRQSRLSDNIPQQASALAAAMVDQPENESAAEAYSNYAQRAVQDDELDLDAAKALQSDRAELVSNAALTAGTVSGIEAIPELADQILRWMVKQGGETAFEAAGVAVHYPFLLRDIDLEQTLLKGLAEGHTRGNLFLGELYYFGLRTSINPQKSEQYLSEARRFRSTAPMARYRLGRLYYLGYLGTPNNQKAVDNLLEAAREGAPTAYSVLASLFFTAHGFQIDRVNAMTFARMSEAGGRPVILRKRVVSTTGQSAAATAGAGAPAIQFVNYNLSERLQVEMTESEIKRAAELFNAERAINPVIRPPVTADVWKRAKL